MTREEEENAKNYVMEQSAIVVHPFLLHYFNLSDLSYQSKTCQDYGVHNQHRNNDHHHNIQACDDEDDEDDATDILIDAIESQRPF